MVSRIDATIPLPFELPPLPEVINHTPWPAQNFIHVDPAGDAFHVMVCRITYSLLGMPRDSEGFFIPLEAAPGEHPPLVSEDRKRSANPC